MRWHKGVGRQWLAALLWWWACALAPALALTAEDDARIGGDLMMAEKALGQMAERMSPVRETVMQILQSLPTVGTEAALALGRIGSGPDDSGLLHVLFMAAVCVLIPGSLALWLLRLTRPWRERALHNPMHARGALRMLLLDVMVWLSFALGAFLCVKLLAGFRAPGGALFLVGLVSAVVRWSATLLFVTLAMRPRNAVFRLVAMPDHTARAISFWSSLAVLIGALTSAVLPTLLRHGLPVPSGQAIALLQGLAVTFCFSVATLHYRRSFVQPPTRAQRVWWGIALVGIPLGLFSWTMAVLYLKFDFFDSLLYTLRIGMASYVVQALLALSERSHWWVRLARHVTNAGAVLVLSILLSDLWIVHRLHLLSVATWEPIRESLITTAITLFLGFMAWRYLDLWTEHRLRRASPGLGPGMDDETPPDPASRLTTLLPLLRVLVGVAILLLVAFLGLSQLGVNVTTLLAGAGVFGLAISFGSQALVKDIVSGVFFMSDDAFRVGEYIDTGRLKGTVERITVRSVRLRHQNGQIHTIPFGQLNAITNYSRDWLTVKFNLRLASDTDFEKTRKCVKRLGQELLEDAEYGKEFLLPLKLQGVTDIVDNALVVRLKFTVRPGNPSMVQREALKRLHRAFAADGIKFASGLITVQQSEGSANLAAAAAAAATSVAAAAANAAPGAPASP